MVESLAHDLARLRHGDHICLPYDDNDECSAIVVPFIAEGLARSERCVFVVEDTRRDDLLKRLAAAGIDAGRAIARGALRLLNPAEIYFRNGPGKFDVDGTLDLIEALLASALAEGFTGVRGSGEVSAADWHGIPEQVMLSYEARLNERFAGRPLVALCRYHRDQWPASMVGHVLRTHPTAIVGDQLCRNPYYEKPDIALGEDEQESARVEWMLRQLRRSAAAEQHAREVTRSLIEESARLAAVDQSRARVEEELRRAVRLRDRLLDDLTKELAGPLGGLSAELDGLLDGRNDGRNRPDLRGHLRRLGGLLEELNEISQLTNRRSAARQQEQEIDEIDLADVARQVALGQRDRLAALGSAVSLHTSEARILGRWDRRRLEQLLGNLLANAGRRGAGHPIDLELGCEGATALLSVRYRGRPVPGPKQTQMQMQIDDEALAFEHGAHAPGQGPHSQLANAGVWVAREIAAGFGGGLSITHHHGDGDPDFTTMTAELPRGGRPQPRTPS